MQPRSLYIHVPFCTRRCFYCDFAVEAVRQPPVDVWIESVAREVELTAREQGWNAPLELDTLYVGGGTPSLLGTGAMERLRGALDRWATLAPDAEWTAEANPESFTGALARDWRSAGINRLSLGVQSFSEAALRWMGRLHGPDGPARAVGAARAAGIENLSVDLIFGLPDHVVRCWEEDLERAIALEPDHISLYGLTAEPGAPLGRRVHQGRENLADEDRYAAEYLRAHERLSEAGFEHYELSSFAKPGARSRHNSVYWNGSPYAAAGPGAHAFLPPVRRWNLRSWAAYRDTLAAARLPVDGEERVDEDAEATERPWLGLRTREGVPIAGLTDAQVRAVAAWERAGWAHRVRDRLVLTPAGWLLLDEIVLELLDAGAATRRAPAARIDAAKPLVQISTSSNP